MGSFAPLMPAGALNVALSNFAKEFTNNALVGDYFAPKVPVARQSFQYVVWNRDNWRVPGSTLRAPGDRPTSTRRSYSTAPYMCQSHALESFVPFESETYGLGLGFSTKKQMTKQLVQQIHLDREVRIANMLLSTSNYPNGVSLVTANQFDNYPAVAETGTGSHPVVLIEQYKSVLRQAGIQDADMVLLISDPVALVLRNHPDTIDRFKFTNAGGIITNEMLSQLFGVKVITGSAVSLNQQNTPSWVWGNSCFLGYAQQAPTQEDISCAKTFTWTGGSSEAGIIPGPPSTVDGYGVLEWIEPHLSEKKYWQSVDWYYDLRPTAPEAGIPILNCLGTYPPVAMTSIASDVEG